MIIFVVVVAVVAVAACPTIGLLAGFCCACLSRAMFGLSCWLDGASATLNKLGGRSSDLEDHFMRLVCQPAHREN